MCEGGGGGRGRKRECMYVLALMDVKGQPLGVGPSLSSLFESGWVSFNLPGCLTPKLLGCSCLCLSSPHRGSHCTVCSFSKGSGYPNSSPQALSRVLSPWCHLPSPPPLKGADAG